MGNVIVRAGMTKLMVLSYLCVNYEFAEVVEQQKRAAQITNVI
jgi:hypothetical protein